MNGVELISSLNRIEGEHGVGRTDMVEDRVLGLNGHENYEHPATMIIPQLRSSTLRTRTWRISSSREQGCGLRQRWMKPA